jgi:general secretion pathway protein D
MFLCWAKRIDGDSVDSVNSIVLRPSCAAGTLAIVASFFVQITSGAPPTRLPPVPAPVATATPKASAPAGAPDVVPNMQFPNSDVVDVLHFYETLTGKKLIMDNLVQGKVNIFISKPVPREEAIKIIEINLLLNGFTLVSAGDDIVKVIGPTKNPRSAGVPVISDESEIPPGEHVISFLFKLRYADPQELAQVLAQYLQSAQTPYTSILPLPKSSSLLVTENSSAIRSVAHIVEQVDIPPAEVVSEFIKLERADAGKVVDLLKDIFEKGNQPTSPTGIRGVRVPQPVPQPGAPTDVEVGQAGALTEEAVVVGKIKLTADVRTNRIHVVTRPINMPFIRKLVAEFDANVEFGKPVTRPLKYISASDVLPVLVQALSEPGVTTQTGAQPGGGSPSPQQTPPPRTTTGSSTSAYTGGFPSNAGGTSSTGSLNISEELSTQPVDTAPKAVTVGNSKLIADQRANTIIILGNSEVVVKVSKILDEMDVKAPQVALSTVIGELTLSEDEEFGVDYFVRHSRGLDTAGTTKFTGIPPFAGGGTTTANPSPSGAPITTGGSVFDPGNLISFTQLATNAASGANVYLAAGRTLAAVVHALETTGRFRVINRPTVFTSNNKKAIIASGTEIPVPVSSLTNVINNTTVNGTAAVASNIEFKRVALQLEVVPLINSEKEVSLDILQKLDSLAGNTIVDGNSIPNIATRYVRTNVSAPTGSTIVLGGLITDQKQKNTNGIPVLDRIPYLGALFRTTKVTNMRTELIILMCPEVTLTNLDMYRLRQKAEDKTHFGPEIDQGECPDCPPRPGADKQLPAPDLPSIKGAIHGQ